MDRWWRTLAGSASREGSPGEGGEPRPPKPPRSDSREIISADEFSASRTVARAFVAIRERLPGAVTAQVARLQEQVSGLSSERKVAVAVSLAGILLVTIGLIGMISNAGAGSQPRGPQEGGRGRGEHSGHLRHRTGHSGDSVHSALDQCSDMVPCPIEWRDTSNAGGFYCLKSGGCRPWSEGPFPTCALQCQIGGKQQTGGGELPRTDSTVIVIQGSASAGKDEALMPLKLEREGAYDLRVVKGGRLLGCAAPIGLFPGQPKYGCSGNYSTAETCDAANFPIKDTKYVAAVHEGCETEKGRGTYGYAYDDGVGLKQCAPVTKYEWVLCPTGDEGPITWEAEAGPEDSTKRFRVTNHCKEAIWIQQAGAEEAIVKGSDNVVKIDPSESYTYAIPNRGLPSTRFLPKTGCDADGNGCEVQSMPPCPPEGCDLPVDTKFESSWGCVHATGDPQKDRDRCALTGQGNPSTYQDWWDGSAVDGWTLPFSVLVDDAGHGLAPGDDGGSPSICGPVVCAKLVAEKLCPKDEYLTPAA